MATTQKRRNADGRIVYRVRIRRKGFPLRTATFHRLSEARNWATTTESETLQSRLSYADQEYTLAATIDRYITDILPNKRPSTTRSQRQQLEWWRNALKGCKLDEVTPIMVAGYRDKLAKRIGPATVNRYLAALSHTFTVATKDWGWCYNNPLRNVRRLREPRGRVRYLSDEERHRLLAACQMSRNPHLHTLVVLALSTGARRGELLGLRWNNVDLDRGVITLHETKNGERRMLPLMGYALELMRSKGIGQIKLDSLVFPGPRRSKPTHIRTAWNTALRRANLDDFRFHDLRHSCASYLAMGGASLAEIAEVLGHKDLDVTRRYAHLSQEHTRKLVGSMNDAIFGDRGIT